MLFSGRGAILIDEFSPRAGGALHDETARNLIASVGGPLAAQADQNEDDDLASMWPS